MNKDFDVMVTKDKDTSYRRHLLQKNQNKDFDVMVTKDKDTSRIVYGKLPCAEINQETETKI